MALDIAHNYIIKWVVPCEDDVSQGPGTSETFYVVCQPVYILDAEDAQGLTAHDFEAYFRQNPVEAAWLPGRPIGIADLKVGPGKRQEPS